MSAQDRGWGPGYPNCQRDKIVTLIVEGVSFPGGVRREVLPLFRQFLSEFHRTVEPLVDGWCWGFACRAIRGSTSPSNHSWGLAVDVNAPSHPLGQSGTFSAEQARQCRKLAARYGLRWGGDYGGRKDEMHFEFMGTPSDAAAITRGLDQEEKHMRRGDSGGRVLALQARLNWWRGEKLTQDGDYGPSTEEAVKRFQQHQGVTADGVWTETEWALLVINATANGHVIKPSSGGAEVPKHSHKFSIEGTTGVA